MNGSPVSDLRLRSLFQDHEEAIRRYCVRRLRPFDVDDAVADIFLVAWRRLDDVPTGDGALLYLYGIARNVVHNHQRSARRQLRLAGRSRVYRPVVPPGPEAQVVVRYEERVVLEALDGLRPSDQEILRLRTWEELSRKETAAVLGISAAAADMRFNRAARRLARALDELGFDSDVSFGPRAVSEGGVP